MTPAERELMYHLCMRIAEEKDRSTFEGLVRQLSELLSEKGRRLTEGQPKDN